MNLRTIGVYTGRFQPFHRGHNAVLLNALKMNCDTVVVVIGSINRPRSPENPFTFDERVEIINASLPEWAKPKVHVVGVNDHKLSDEDWKEEWMSVVKNAVVHVLNHGSKIFTPLGYRDAEVVLLGSPKDEKTAKYLESLCDSDFMRPQFSSEYPGVSGTYVRRMMFSDYAFDSCKLDHSCIENDAAIFKINEIIQRNHDQFVDLAEWDHAVRVSNEKWKNSPYPPIFVTADSMIRLSGDGVVLVRRKGPVGKGLWALPGGYVNANELIIDAAIRETDEETNIKIFDMVRNVDVDLRDQLEATHVIDAVARSHPRGRIITHVHEFDVPGYCKITVSPGDDADDVRIFEFDEIRSDMMFEDHYDILKRLF